MRINPTPEAATVLPQLRAWFTDYNLVHPHADRIAAGRAIASSESGMERARRADSRQVDGVAPVRLRAEQCSLDFGEVYETPGRESPDARVCFVPSQRTVIINTVAK